jgi:hypothetical protein
MGFQQPYSVLRTRRAMLGRGIAAVARQAKLRAWMKLRASKVKVMSMDA